MSAASSKLEMTALATVTTPIVQVLGPTATLPPAPVLPPAPLFPPAPVLPPVPGVPVPLLCVPPDPLPVT